MVVLAILATFTIGLFIYAKYNSTDKNLDADISAILPLVISFLTSFGAGVYVFRYLNKSDYSHSEDYQLRNIEDLIAVSMDKQRKAIFDKVLKKDDTVQAENLAKEVFQEKIDSLTKEEISEKIRNEFKDEALVKVKFEKVEKELSKIRYRIDAQIRTTNRYAIINLTIGIITTFLVIAFLGLSLLNVNTAKFSSSDYLIHFVPRISLSILIELFAYFFLRLYNKNLDEIKYWNNELTNIETKGIAIIGILLQDDKATFSKLALKIFDTERNFVLKKGESTVELERSRMSDYSNNHLLESLVKILNTKK